MADALPGKDAVPRSGGCILNEGCNRQFDRLGCRQRESLVETEAGVDSRTALIAHTCQRWYRVLVER